MIVCWEPFGPQTFLVCSEHMVYLPANCFVLTDGGVLLSSESNITVEALLLSAESIVQELESPS